MRERGAGIVETAIAMSLVGVLVLVSVNSLGGGIHSYITTGVVPVVRGGAEPSSGDYAEGENSSTVEAQSASSVEAESSGGFEGENFSSTPNGEYPSVSLQGPEPMDQGPVVAYEVSLASEGASSSVEWVHPLLNPNFDWSTLTFEDAVAAGIVSHPDPDHVGPGSLNEDAQQSSSSAELDWYSDPNAGTWCLNANGDAYLSTEPCPEFASNWDSSPVAGGLAPPVISWCQDEAGNSYMQENAPCP